MSYGRDAVSLLPRFMADNHHRLWVVSRMTSLQALASPPEYVDNRIRRLWPLGRAQRFQGGRTGHRGRCAQYPRDWPISQSTYTWPPHGIASTLMVHLSQNNMYSVDAEYIQYQSQSLSITGTLRITWFQCVDFDRQSRSTSSIT
jgi:hypothetical protein